MSCKDGSREGLYICISAGTEGAGEGGVVEGVSLFIVAVPGCDSGRKTLSESQVGAITFSISVLEYVRTKPFCGYPVCLSLVLRLIARTLDKNLDKKILQASCWSDFATSVWRLLVLQPIGCIILLRVRTSKLEGRTQLYETSRTGFNWRLGPVIGSPQVSLPSESSGALTSLTHRGVEICVMIRVKKLR